MAKNRNLSFISAWVAFGERLKKFQWVAVALAFLGLMLILSPWDLRGGFGALLAVGAAVCWAASAVVAKVLRKRHEVDLRGERWGRHPPTALVALPLDEEPRDLTLIVPPFEFAPKTVRLVHSHCAIPSMTLLKALISPQRRKGREEDKASPSILNIEKPYAEFRVLGVFAVQKTFLQWSHQ